jgi:glutamate-1-semialdehyde 2,1-aminomutase
MRQGLRDAVAELGLDGFVSGFGSVFVLYFVKERPSGYRDLLADDDTAYREFHRRMTDKGFLMLPLALKRNHISASHTPEDVDATVDAARTVLADMRSAGTV